MTDDGAVTMEEMKMDEEPIQGSDEGAPGPRAGSDAEVDEPARMTRREMLDQLQAMASQLADEAPPAIKEAAARAAELAAVAARSSGPFAQRVADVTGDAAERFADRSEHFASEVRASLDSPAESEAEADAAGEDPAAATDA